MPSLAQSTSAASFCICKFLGRSLNLQNHFIKIEQNLRKRRKNSVLAIWQINNFEH
ncbi:hypothetical protein H6G35_16005 [Aulosira sp. FACHB-113]|nr:hypothetical protein [Aulosira sp. FACHB-113]